MTQPNGAILCRLRSRARCIWIHLSQRAFLPVQIVGIVGIDSLPRRYLLLASRTELNLRGICIIFGLVSVPLEFQLFQSMMAHSVLGGKPFGRSEQKSRKSGGSEHVEAAQPHPTPWSSRQQVYAPHKAHFTALDAED